MGKNLNHQKSAHKLTGLTSELLVAVQLLNNGYSVAWPLMDVDGYDLIADDGKGSISRVQVKSSDTPQKCGTYRITFAKGYKTKLRYTPSEVDTFVAVVKYPSGPAFYVIPVGKINQLHYVFWPPNKHPAYDKWRVCKLEEYRDRWDLVG